MRAAVNEALAQTGSPLPTTRSMSQRLRLCQAVAGVAGSRLLSVRGSSCWRATCPAPPPAGPLHRSTSATGGRSGSRAHAGHCRAGSRRSAANEHWLAVPHGFSDRVVSAAGDHCVDVRKDGRLRQDSAPTMFSMSSSRSCCELLLMTSSCGVRAEVEVTSERLLSWGGVHVHRVDSGGASRSTQRRRSQAWHRADPPGVTWLGTQPSGGWSIRSPEIGDGNAGVLQLERFAREDANPWQAARGDRQGAKVSQVLAASRSACQVGAIKAARLLGRALAEDTCSVTDEVLPKPSRLLRLGRRRRRCIGRSSNPFSMKRSGEHSSERRNAAVWPRRRNKAPIPI